MDQKKIGSLIKKLRIDNNLTQKEFALKYNVSFQAVSKWERGYNLPDIYLLKQIADDFNININDLLDGKINEKTNQDLVSKPRITKKNLFLILGTILVIILSIFFLFKLTKKDDFVFKTLSSNCSNFNISGSIAYNSTKSFIYITNITYCGDELDKTSYQSILCTLYESHGNTNTALSKYNYGKKPITLEEFLKKVEFKVDYFSKSCKYYEENSLFLEIDAIDINGKTINHKIPLNMNNCN